MLNKNNKNDWMRVAVVTLFLSVPFASSLISTWHIFDMFELGNPSWMSVVLSIVIELGALASLLALANMKKLKMVYIWFIFIILFVMQIAGNVFYSYKYITEMLLIKESWLTTFIEFIVTLGLVEDVTTPIAKLILSCFIGLPIPLISLSFLKSTVDYLKPEEEKQDGILKENVNLLTEKPVVEEPVVEEIKEEVSEEPSVEYSKNVMSTNPTLPLEEKLPYVEEPKEEPKIVEEIKEPKIEIPSNKNNGIHIAVQPNINKP